MADPITFTDEQGNEWTLRRQRDDDEDADAVLLYDVTAEDLARAGYLPDDLAESEMHRRFRDLSDRVLAALELSAAERKELEALRALESHIRSIEGIASGGPIGGRTGDLLAAVEEARKA